MVIRLIRHAFADGRGPALWLLGLLAGILAGYATLGLRIIISQVETLAFGVTEEELATAAGQLPAWLLVLIPLTTGALVALLLWLGQRLNLTPESRVLGVGDLLEARAVKNGLMPIAPGLYSALVSAISLGGGASAGREGPAVHLGGTIAALLSRLTRLPPRGSRILLACGAAAAVSASFNAPVAGALFAFEVVLGHYALRSIAPVAVASVVGAVIVRHYFGQDPVFGVPDMLGAHLWDFPAAAALGLAAAGLAIALDRGLLTVPGLVQSHAERWRIPLWILPLPGGLLIGLLALIAPEILGVGYEATSNALNAEYGFGFLIGLIALKLLATILTIGFRFSGGVFSPSLYLGAMLGSAFGLVWAMMVGDQTAGPAFFALIGMGAVAGAVLGAPLSTTLIVFELTQSYEAAVAVLVAVSLATVATQSVIGGSLFQKQVQRKGYDLAGGSSRLILQMVRVRSFMMPLDDWSQDEMPETACVFEDDTLGRALGVLDAEELEGAPVRRRHGDQAVIGWVTKADAHAAYAKALKDAHEEEHH
ncbi:chloride channel protein [Maricaulis sp. D1M11]|uniref:chloride channel protein n=1 Tax=Maricaulis sp. D1M11 TaxID=3076117 RepID=UPI0039B643E5